jgi:phosphatidylserine/phosphatidylglycerophosphate/cardiolipin synthase-like enzyme
MRIVTPPAPFRACAIAGTHTVLIALDCAEALRHGLLGFAFKRETVGDTHGQPKWLRSLKVFKSVVPDPLKERDPRDPSKPKRFSTWEHPVQSFLWSDYTAQPDTAYKFTIVPMYGRPGALEPHRGVEFEIRTEKEFDRGHGVWFNRGAIASQAFAREFGNIGPVPPDNPDPNHKTTRWLSRGLLEACLGFIDQTPAGDGLRVAAYEFTYRPVLDALRAAIERGVDVRIVYHDTTGDDGAAGANEKAIALSRLPKTAGGRKVLYPRSQTKIPHNKFMVRLTGGTTATTVWTGSTNLTPSGFLGQTNVGHLIDDAATAKTFLAYWNLVKGDPARDKARAAVMELTPDPPALIEPNAIATVFSPRPKSEMLGWYAARIGDAVGSVMFTAAFGVAEQLVPALVKDRDFLRYILMEKPPTEALKKRFAKDRDLIISYGDVLGEMYRFKDGKPVARRKIAEFDLDKWFLQEDHFRREGFVFFVHTKFLLIDPLSNDPLVCSGSANFSSNSLLQNDENMLLIRGDTRVADIYLTEFDRIFRHFYFRNVANRIEASGGEAEGAFLAETSAWTDGYFKPGRFKTRRRQQFFADPALNWTQNAAKSPPAKPRRAPAAASRAKRGAKPKAAPGVAKKRPAARKTAAKKRPSRR